jgi:hypothetical protein
MVEPRGYGIEDPQEEDNHWGVDACGDEILIGDKYVTIDGDIVLTENIERYVKENFEVEEAE